MINLASSLSENKILGSLDHESIAKLSGAATSRIFRTGECVTHHGDVWPYLFLVGEGEITAFKESHEGRNLLIARFGEGEIFWGLAFFIEGAATPVRLEASKESNIYIWSREFLLPCFLDNGHMSWELTLLMVRRMLHASDIVEGLAFQPVAGRLANWLLEEYQDAVGDFVSRNMTLDEIAASIGTTREVVCRLLYRFAEAGAVEINRTELMIADSQILEDYVSREKG